MESGSLEFIGLEIPRVYYVNGEKADVEEYDDEYGNHIISYDDTVIRSDSDSDIYNFDFTIDKHTYSFITEIPNTYTDEDIVWELRRNFYETMPNNKDKDKYMSYYKKLRKNSDDPLVQKAVTYAIDDLESGKPICIDEFPIYEDSDNITAENHKRTDTAWVYIDCSNLNFTNHEAETTVNSAGSYPCKFRVKIEEKADVNEYMISEMELLD